MQTIHRTMNYGGRRPVYLQPAGMMLRALAFGRVETESMLGNSGARNWGRDAARNVRWGLYA